MADTKTGGTFLLKKSDFVAVVDAEGNDLPPVPKHWTADDLPAGAKKKSGSSSSTSRQDNQTDQNAEPAGNASRDDWAAYATKVKGAKPEDLVDADGKDLTRDEIRTKYGTPTA